MPTESGYCKIMPKSAGGLTHELVIAVGFNQTNDSDDVNIEQRYYVDDANYKDEWLLRASIKIGISTDNSTTEQCHSAISSYTYANYFYETLVPIPAGEPTTYVHHYNNKFTNTASPTDFSQNGAISDDIDFMIYIGHGHPAHDDRGNHLHYDCAYVDTQHVYDDNTKIYTVCDSAGNVYSGEVKFGSSTSDLRWVWLYTCNFLNTIEDTNDDDSNDTNDDNIYVTNAKLKEMMNGAHIIMGYASRATLCEPMAKDFGAYLRSGMSIYDAYFTAGHTGEASVEVKNHYQKIIYIPQVRYETIYSPPTRYEYDHSDALIVKRSIHDAYYAS